MAKQSLANVLRMTRPLVVIDEGHKATTLWVDAATKLPLRLEYELTDPKVLPAGVSALEFVLTDFTWDPELDGFKSADELFSLTPPAGHKLIDQRK